MDEAALNWRFVEASGLRLHYGEVGSGPCVILLHGTGPGATAWSSFQHNVEQLSAHMRVVLLDLPRFGKSDKITVDQPRLTFLSGVVRDFMDAIGVTSAHIIGNSMGGQTAMKLAIDSPERVDRLVLIGPAAVGHSLFTPMPTEAGKLIARYYRDGGPSLEKMRTLLTALAYDPAFVTEEVVQQRYAASAAPDVLEVNRGEHWVRQSLEEELEQLAAPTLLVWGQDDRATALDIGLLLLKRLPDARLHVFGRCGHWAQAEHATEFNRISVDFLLAEPVARKAQSAQQEEHAR